MRKFGFLLAIMAVFAMSAVAFAADETCNALGTYAGSDPVNNGAVVMGDSAYETTAYYITGTKPGAGDQPQVGVQAFIKTTDNTDVLAAKSADTEAKVWKSAAITTAVSPAASSDQVISPATDLTAYPAQIALTTLGVYATGVDKDSKPLSPATAKSQDLTISFNAINLSDDITVTTLPGSNGSINISADFAANNPGLALNELTYIKVISKDTAPVELDKAAGAKVIGGLSIAYDETKYTLTVSNDQTTVAPAGRTVTLQIVGDTGAAIKIDEGDVEGITVAGVDDTVVVGVITVTVEKSEVDKVIDILSADKGTVSADVVKAIKSGDHSILLTKSGDTYIVNGAAPTPKALSNDVDAVDMTVAFLALDASGKLVLSADAPETVNVVVNRAVDEADRTASFDITSNGKSIPVTEGVASISIRPGTATNDSYTAYVIETPVTGGSTIRGAKPAEAKTYAAQKFEVKKSTPNDTKSSSGACSMGAGLVALAGLALVLRKKD